MIRNASFLAILMAAASVFTGCFPKKVDPAKYQVRFGLVKMDAKGKPFLEKETERIPLLIGEKAMKFGYELISHDAKPYTLHCVLHFPSPPQTVTGRLAESKSTPPGTTVVTPNFEWTGGPLVDYFWFDPGDPFGSWSIDIFVNDTLIRSVPFEVYNSP